MTSYWASIVTLVLSCRYSAMNNNTFVAIGSKYDISSYNESVKSAVWNVFAMSLESVLKSLSFSIFSLLLLYFYCILLCILCAAALWRNKRWWLELLYAESRFFDTPPLFWPKISGIPLRVDPRCWSLQRATTQSPRLTNSEIIFEVFQLMWSIPQLYGRTDGQQLAVAIPRFAVFRIFVKGLDRCHLVLSAWRHDDFVRKQPSCTAPWYNHQCKLRHRRHNLSLSVSFVICSSIPGMLFDS